MIRRKHNQGASHQSVSLQQQLRSGDRNASRGHKFKYQIEGNHNYSYHCSQRGSERKQSTEKYEINNENSQTKKQAWADWLLKRKQLYEGKHMDLKYEQSQEKTLNKTTQKFTFDTRNHPLGQKNINNKTQMISTSRQPGKTIRKNEFIAPTFNAGEEHVKQKLLRTSRRREEAENLQQLNQHTQSDLDAKYDLIWNSNQEERCKEDIEDITMRNLEQNNIIVNARQNRRKQYVSRDKYEGKLNYEYGIEQKAFLNRNFKDMRNCRVHSIELKPTRKNSPVIKSKSRRIGYQWCENISRRGESIPDIPRPGISPIERETEVRLRMLDDFNGKISMRIRELTSAMDDMRYMGH